MNAKGREGEDRAAAFLESSGYSVVRRNVRVPGGEIDLVCRDGATIVFVEVKRRDTRSFGSALSRSVGVNARPCAASRPTICRSSPPDRNFALTSWRWMATG